MADKVLLYAHCMISITTQAEKAQISILQSGSNRSYAPVTRAVSFSPLLTHTEHHFASEPVGVCIWECGGNKLATAW